MSLENLYNQAIEEFNQGNLAQAQSSCENFLKHNPSQSHGLHLLGMINLKLGNFKDAEWLISEAIKANPKEAEYYCNLGNVYHAQGRTYEAANFFKRSIETNENYAQGFCNLANSLNEIQEFGAAEPLYLRALSLDPNLYEAYSGLGSICRTRGQLEKAVEYYGHALSLKPLSAEVMVNLGNVMRLLGRFNEAESLYWRAKTLKADLHIVTLYEGMLQLQRGKWAEGWKNYEARLKNQNPKILEKMPKKEDLAHGLDGKRVLLTSEQGLGDVLQFVRFSNRIQELGADVTLAVQDSLTKIISESVSSAVITIGDVNLAEYDYVIPLMSIPYLLGLTEKDISIEDAYIFADNEKVEHWNVRLGMHSKIRVGLAWKGSSTYIDDFYRSIPFKNFEKLLGVEGVQFISLHKEILDADASKLTFFSDLDAGPQAFVDTAALIENLDLVICSDSSIAHLAAALGKPVWMLVSSVPDWRWMMNRSDSPWYPNLKIYRTTKPADWSASIELIAEDLKKYKRV